MTSNITINAIPSNYVNINSNNYLFNSGAFTGLSGSAKGIFFNDDFDHALVDGGAANSRYRSVVNGKMRTEAFSSGTTYGPVFQKGIKFQYFNRMKIKFRMSFANWTGNATRTIIRIMIFELSNKPGTDGATAGTSMRAIGSIGSYDSYVVNSDYTEEFDISGINYEGWLAIGFAANFGTDSRQQYLDMEQIWLCNS